MEPNDRENDTLLNELPLVTPHPQRDDRFFFTTTTEGPLHFYTIPQYLMSFVTEAYNETFEVTNANLTNAQLSSDVHQEKTNKISIRKLVFVAGYLIYVLYEMVWFAIGFFTANKTTMYRHLSRFLVAHLEAATFLVYALRVPVAILYFSLVAGHQLLCLALFKEIPKTLFPQNATKSQYYILTSYMMVYKVIGFILNRLGRTEQMLKDNIEKIKRP